MKSPLTTTLASVALTCALTTPAQAMSFITEPGSNGLARVIMTGDINHGDADRFKRFLGSVGIDKISYFVLNSEGGFVMEAADMADEIAHAQRNTLVRPNGLCASACFLLFTAGTYRIAGKGAQI